MREVADKLFPSSSRPRRRWETVTRRRASVDAVDRILMKELYDEERDRYDYAEEEWQVAMEICEAIWRSELEGAMQ